MAEIRDRLAQVTFSCVICLEVLKDPVSISCSHTYCMDCIKAHWDGEDKKKIYSCPQCRKTFTRRPELVKNTMLAELVEAMMQTGLHDGHADHCYTGDECRACKVCTGRKLKDLKSCVVSRTQEQIQRGIQGREKNVKLLQQEVEAINSSADAAVAETGEVFSELILLLLKRRSDVTQQVRSQQESEVSQFKELQEKLEKEITELKRKDAELKKMGTDDNKQFLKNYSPLFLVSECTAPPSIDYHPLRYHAYLLAGVSEVRDKLQDTVSGMSEMWPEIEADGLLPNPQSEPETRADFLQYSQQQITLDPNTAHRQLLLSERNTKATLLIEEQSRSSHPDRFTDCRQVLSGESLTGRSYCEVEWTGRGVQVAVAYKSISRAAGFRECAFGVNDKSWALDTHSNSFFHNKVKTPVSGAVTSKLGVYLDHSAGTLSFYSVSDTMTLLHRVQTTFTQPLHVGLLFFSCGATAKFTKLK